LKKVLLILVINIFLMIMFISCKKSSSGPKETKGNITGAVKDLLTGDTITTDSAYIYLEDSLLTKTDENGNYTISSMQEGTYALTCSSLSVFFKKERNIVDIVGGKTVTHDFYLEHLGLFYGEFQDFYLYDSLIIVHPEMAAWNEQEIFEGTTGATIIGKNLLQAVEQGEVFLADSLLDRTDSWGVYGAALPVGSYTLRGTCAGGENLQYEDKILNVEILPDSVHYFNFFLHRQAVAKFVVK
jgi:hypothetical protein